MIDHTLLRANATAKEIHRLCREAIKFNFFSVCVNPCNVALCRKYLRGTKVRVCTVIGFPLGSSTTLSKSVEACEAAASGADEMDMVMNIGAFKSGDYKLVKKDIEALRGAVPGKILKVIIETSYLTDREKIRACLIAREAGADFVKTSTGFGPGGAKVDDIKLMRSAVGRSMGVKASGGVKSADIALSLIKAGADRIGSSNSVQIMKGM